jgi:hypothetical protein
MRSAPLGCSLRYRLPASDRRRPYSAFSPMITL